MLTKLRAQLGWWLLRFRGSIKSEAQLRIDPQAQMQLSRQRRQAVEDERVLAMWFDAARAEGIDLSPTAMVTRYTPEFNSDSPVVILDNDQDRESGYDPIAALHRRGYAGV
jgi:hypothetical protein